MIVMMSYTSPPGYSTVHNASLHDHQQLTSNYSTVPYEYYHQQKQTTRTVQVRYGTCIYRVNSN